MQLKTFVLPIKNVFAAKAEINAFLRSRLVLSVKKEFVADGENSFWTFCVEYLENAPASDGPPGNKLPKVDYKEVLKPAEFEVFSRLRDWRKGVAEQEGVPVYVVFTGEQLAEMVRKRVSTKADRNNNIGFRCVGAAAQPGHRKAFGLTRLPPVSGADAGARTHNHTGQCQQGAKRR